MGLWLVGVGEEEKIDRFASILEAKKDKFKGKNRQKQKIRRFSGDNFLCRVVNSFAVCYFLFVLILRKRTCQWLESHEQHRKPEYEPDNDEDWVVSKNFNSKNKNTRTSFFTDDKKIFNLYGVLVILLLAMPAIFIWSIFFLPIPFAMTGVLSRISLLFPFVWLASHVNIVINRRNKLYLEYEHKRIALELYFVFKDKIDKDSNVKEAFTRAMIDVVLRFPSIIGEAQESASPMDKILKVLKEKD